ncbi:hypothetical protein Pyn_11732 [Prunus yedoensis var. nudiflora]|uniref:Uncharacterized protein n=1 Tax=Prunus yedoensis var. nudiflora TaxID=2094558 RepID=A0A314XPP9_PRUYE|nr:hypothetical protein Pyn_11732 [Prunus yedoensis var. nudiflora]
MKIPIMEHNSGRCLHSPLDGKNSLKSTAIATFLWSPSEAVGAALVSGKLEEEGYMCTDDGEFIVGNNGFWY